MTEPLLTYEELVHWRNVCEWLHEHYRTEPCDPYYLVKQFGQEVAPLIGVARARRQPLWEAWEIQLIYWEQGTRKRDPSGWRLRANWEFQLYFMEQVVIAGKPAESLPRLWLDQKAKRQQQKELKAWHQIMNQDLLWLGYSLSDLETIAQQGEYRSIKNYLQRVRTNTAKIRALLREYHEKFQTSKPDPGSAVLGGIEGQRRRRKNRTEAQPQSGDAVLGDASRQTETRALFEAKTQ